MLAILWSSIGNIFDTIRCKKCKKKFYTAFGFLFHLWFKHKVKVTRRDLKFLAIHSLPLSVFFRGFVCGVFYPFVFTENSFAPIVLSLRIFIMNIARLPIYGNRAL